MYGSKQFSFSCFLKILDRYGYKYGKLRTRDAQIFKPNNLEWRKKYLDAIKRYDEDPEWQVVYQGKLPISCLPQSRVKNRQCITFAIILFIRR